MTRTKGLLRRCKGLVARVELLSLFIGNQTKTRRTQDGLGAALHTQLRQDMLDMGLDGVLDDLQVACDLFIRVPLGK